MQKRIISGKYVFISAVFVGLVFAASLAVINNFGLDKIAESVSGLFGREASAQTETISLLRQDCTGYSNCYTSMSAWEADRNRNLVAAGEQETLRIEGTWTAPDTTAVTIEGWTTDATHYIKIYTTAEARHDGKWNEGKYRLGDGTAHSQNGFIQINEEHIVIEGLQIFNSCWGSDYGIMLNSDNVTISHNILKGSSGGGLPLYLPVNSNTTNYKVYNNIIYNSNGMGIYSFSKAYIYNNIVVDCGSDGIYSYSGRVISKNNLIFNSVDDYDGTFHADSTNNAYSEGTDPGINGVDISSYAGTDIFADYNNDDFHLKAGSPIIDQGADLSSDANLSFTDDIDGSPRSGSWDIGADEYITSDSAPPNVTSISDSGPQGLGENVTISANVTDSNGIDTVLIGITPPSGTETNHTMANQSSIYTYNYLNYTNGTYSYKIYANDTNGNLNNSETGSFELYSDVYLHVKTLKDTYGDNEIVNITDPFEFDLSGFVVSEDVFEDDLTDSGVEEEINGISSISRIFSSVSDFIRGLYDGVVGVTGISVGNAAEDSGGIQKSGVIIFQSKWDSAGSGVDYDSDGKADPDDGGNWHYAFHAMMTDTAELLRVSGDESSVGNGGPDGPPPLAPNTTYYLRMKRVGNNITDGQIFLQDNFAEQSEVYSGMWFYFEDNMTFLDSVKFFDLKDGDLHNTLFGFNWGSAYCIDNDYGCDYGNIGHDYYGDWPYSHNFMMFKYRIAAGQDGCSEMFNYWESRLFEQNLDQNDDPLQSRIYDANDVARVKVEGGKWMALIVHTKHHATDGIVEAWLYDGNSLKKVMEWNKDTVWNVAGSEDGHDFYTLSPNGNGVNQLQVNAYWNGWVNYVGTKYAWLSNVIVATSFDEVANYLGVSTNDTSPPERSNPQPNGTLSAGTTQTTISLQTNESATCKYSETPNTAYADIPNTFGATGTTNHSQLITGLQDGQTKTYYVRCQDTAGNPNTSDFEISFSVASQGQGDTETISLLRQDCTGYSNCYTSMSAWEADRNRDLVAAGEQETLRIEGTWTSPDTTAVTIDGWTTDATHYIKIYTTEEARHDGKWNEGNYRLEPSSSGNVISIKESYTKLFGLQIKPYAETYSYGMCCDAPSTNNEIAYNIIKGNSESATGIQTRGNDKVYNNLVYDFNRAAGSNGIYCGSSIGLDYIYNNIVINITGDGIEALYDETIAKNNLCFNCSYCYSNTFSGESTNNAYSQGTDPGSNGLNITGNLSTDLFVDPDNDDFHLKTGSPVIDQGVDLSSDANLAFADDIDGETRTGTWDIGADEEGGTPPQVCTDIPGGVCKDNQCSTYTDCSSLTGTGCGGYCCSGTCTSDTTAPTISSVSSSSVTQNSATITWTTDETATSQVEYGQTTSYGSQTTEDTNLVNSHSVNLTSLSSGTEYHYRVKSKDSSNNEAISEDYTFTTTAPDTQAPTIPQNLSATAVSSSQINLSWTASTDNVGVAGYNIYRNSSLIDTSATNSYSDTGLIASTAYSYTVSAYDAVPNTSGQSSSAGATTQSASSGVLFETTFDCPEWVTTDGSPNCDGLARRGTNDNCEEKYGQITSPANNPDGGGGKGARTWVGDGWSNASGGTMLYFDSPHPELWVRWYMFYPAGFSWSFLNFNKILYFDMGLPSSCIVEFKEWDKLALKSGISQISDPGNGWDTVMVNGGNDGNGHKTADGQWHYYEVHLKMDTNGSNGVGEMWIDGVRRLYYNNINWGTESGWNWFTIGSNEQSPNNGMCLPVDFDDMKIVDANYSGFVNDAYGNPMIGSISQGGDTTSPTLSAPSPTGTLSSGTTQTTISLQTNELATCKYSETPNTAYAEIPNTFGATGTTNHSQTITGLQDGQTKTYYVRCQDTAGNPNTSDFEISFFVASQGDDDDDDDDDNNDDDEQQKKYFSNDGKIYKNLKNTSSSSGKVSYSKEPSQNDLINLKITPSFGQIEITIEVWNTSGDYYKKWKEDASSASIISEHIVGDLKLNTSYQVFVDGELFGTFTSNSSGEISFTYNKGYSEKTFEVKEEVAGAEGEGLAETGKRVSLIFYLFSFLSAAIGAAIYSRKFFFKDLI